ncbi:MAG: PEP-utilizing enzyme [Thermoplasmata archaeon]|nr:PEP-utilizing enzyme [Thermoplasmata archaeon]
MLVDQMGNYIIYLGESGSDLKKFGGKAANLTILASSGFAVPPGIVVNVSAYEKFIEDNSLGEEIGKCLENSNLTNDSHLENCSKTIQNMILSGKFDPQISNELRDAIRRIGEDNTWAVRSSAFAEDMPGASFAGQQDSYLGVATDDIEEYIKKCWASYWNIRAITYRLDSDIPHLEGGMAVLIQKMVDAISSGVVFTIDPVKRNKDRMIIESSWGLGEAIVSGKVVPDRFTIDKTTSEIVLREISKKTKGVFLSKIGSTESEIETARRNAPSINDQNIRNLASLGAIIEEEFGAPQDIEWAIDKERIWILQSRPVTTVKAGDETLWTRGYGDDYWSEVASPLSFSLLGHYLTEYVNREGSKVMGYKNLTDKDLLIVHKAHVYFNSSVLEEVFTYNPRFSRTKELLSYFPMRDQERIASAKTRILSRLMAEFRIALFDPDGIMLRTDKAYKEWSQKYLEEMKTFDSLNLTKLTDEQLHSEFLKMEKMYIKHYRLIRYGMVTHSIGTNLIIKRWLTDWLNDRSGAIYSKLISGLRGNKTIETNIAISKLANAARDNLLVVSKIDKTSSNDFLQLIRSDPDYYDFNKQLEEFLREYGHRSHTRETFYPRWVDDPTLVIDMVRTLMASGKIDLEELERRRIQERIETEKEIFQRLSKMKYGFFRKTIFKMVLNLAQTYLMFRENQRFFFDHQVYRWRRLFMEYGRRFAERKLIEAQDCIFFLSKEEIFKSARTGKPLDRQLLKDRRKEFEAYKGVLPPKFLQGGVEFDDPIIDSEDAIKITGTPSSPGIVTSRIRVIDSIEHLPDIRDKEILVTSNTDPGWTAIFSKLSGLITETGGILSHGAVVSREYGIPAVTAVKNATNILKTGQEVTLDGNDGVVLIKAEMKDTDIFHEFKNHPNWNESYYFNFYDRTSDIYGFMRIGLNPKIEMKNVFCFFIMPDGKMIGIKESTPDRDKTLSIKGLNFEKLVPEKKWKLRCSSTMTGAFTEKVEFDLDFESLNDIFDYREAVTSAGRMMSKDIASEHLEQFGKIQGRLKIGEKVYSIDALGERDHSWGIRDWIAPKLWFWLNAHFSEVLSVNITKLVTDIGEVYAGFIFEDGKNIPILNAEISPRYDSKGRPLDFKMKLYDKIGNTHEIDAIIIRDAIVTFEVQDGRMGSVMHETLAKYKFRDRTGFGIAEFLTRL